MRWRDAPLTNRREAVRNRVLRGERRSVQIRALVIHRTILSISIHLPVLQILGVGVQATDNEIKTAYRRLVSVLNVTIHASTTALAPADCTPSFVRPLLARLLNAGHQASSG